MKLGKAELRRRLGGLKGLALDVDGVLTDGGMYYGPQGELLKKFNTKDGMGVSLLRKAGLIVALISGEQTDIIKRRAEKLGITDVYEGVLEKGKVFAEFCRRHGLTPKAVGYVGDDVNDLPAMAQAGIAFAVADAVPVVRRAAGVVTRCRGGEGAVREVAEMILAVRTS